MSEKRWGDAAEFQVKRGDETVTLMTTFRRKFARDSAARADQRVGARQPYPVADRAMSGPPR